LSTLEKLLPRQIVGRAPPRARVMSDADPRRLTFEEATTRRGDGADEDVPEWLRLKRAKGAALRERLPKRSSGSTTSTPPVAARRASPPSWTPSPGSSGGRPRSSSSRVVELGVLDRFRLTATLVEEDEGGGEEEEEEDGDVDSDSASSSSGGLEREDLRMRVPEVFDADAATLAGGVPARPSRSPRKVEPMDGSTSSSRPPPPPTALTSLEFPETDRRAAAFQARCDEFLRAVDEEIERRRGMTSGVARIA
jgi:hypothetical protein